MRIAFFSDIHANLPALRAAYAAAAAAGARRVVIAGDASAYQQPQATPSFAAASK